MLLRLFFGGLYLNKGVLARFRHGLLHLNCSWHWWWLLNPKATTGPGLGNAAMTDQIIRIGVTVAAIVLYFYVGNLLIQRFTPESDVAPYILIGVGMVGAYEIRKRRRNRGEKTAASE